MLGLTFTYTDAADARVLTSGTAQRTKRHAWSALTGA